MRTLYAKEFPARAGISSTIFKVYFPLVVGVNNKIGSSSVVETAETNSLPMASAIENLGLQGEPRASPRDSNWSFCPASSSNTQESTSSSFRILPLIAQGKAVMEKLTPVVFSRYSVALPTSNKRLELGKA